MPKPDRAIAWLLVIFWTLAFCATVWFCHKPAHGLSPAQWWEIREFYA